MSLTDAYSNGRFGLSFELFPPKTPESAALMWRTVDDLMAFEPAMITCTYGAGGSTRGTTLDVLRGVRDRHSLPVASHLTCVGSSVDELRDYLQEAVALGVAAIVALRGDPPKGETEFRQAAGGLRYASDLVALIRSEFPALGILVAGYPETHQEAVSPDADLENRNASAMPAAMSSSRSSSTKMPTSSGFATAARRSASGSRSCRA